MTASFKVLTLVGLLVAANGLDQVASFNKNNLRRAADGMEMKNECLECLNAACLTVRGITFSFEGEDKCDEMKCADIDCSQVIEEAEKDPGLLIEQLKEWGKKRAEMMRQKNKEILEANKEILEANKKVLADWQEKNKDQLDERKKMILENREKYLQHLQEFKKNIKEFQRKTKKQLKEYRDKLEELRNTQMHPDQLDEYRQKIDGFGKESKKKLVEYRNRFRKWKAENKKIMEEPENDLKSWQKKNEETFGNLVKQIKEQEKQLDENKPVVKTATQVATTTYPDNVDKIVAKKANHCKASEDPEEKSFCYKCHKCEKECYQNQTVSNKCKKRCIPIKETCDEKFG